MAEVFTYGSLMCADIMTAVSGVAAVSEPAMLLGYRRYALIGEDYPALLAEVGANTSGQLYRDIPDESLRRLDVFEGEYYRRCELVVRLENGEQRKAQTYVFKPQYRDLVADWAWNFEHFLNFGKAKFEYAYLGFRQLSE